MFLRLNHQGLAAYQYAKALCLECYRITTVLPSEERFNLVQQIRRASISVMLNLSEGSSRKSAAERKRFYEIARGSVIELDAALEICNDLGYLKNYDCEIIASNMRKTFGTLSNLLKTQNPPIDPFTHSPIHSLTH
ncbi:four helix bundle protein [Flavihumibacter stibioxidans]|uniref:Four helix bundle protein n=1 Tax=Flavihumibacter stibioxidans TaxID=1834163 RepID=A0ABR7M983_9BACT|nr:four helix bundle protein [Flavihumibacter stibioxidans]MBC6491578.1 hypothetical protein [Flavihumibacter stibioxidans]